MMMLLRVRGSVTLFNSKQQGHVYFMPLILFLTISLYSLTRISRLAIILFIIVVVIATNQDKMSDSFQDGMGAAKGTVENMEK